MQVYPCGCDPNLYRCEGKDASDRDMALAHFQGCLDHRCHESIKEVLASKDYSARRRCTAGHGDYPGCYNYTGPFPERYTQLGAYQRYLNKQNGKKPCVNHGHYKGFCYACKKASEKEEP